MNQKTPIHTHMPPDVGAGKSAEQSAKRDWELLLLVLGALAMLILLLSLFVPIAWRRAHADAAAWEEKHPQTEAGEEKGGEGADPDRPDTPDRTTELPVSNEIRAEDYMPVTSDATQIISEAVLDASHAILVDLTTCEAVAQRLPDERIYPASMTKIMTVLVAVEALSAAELETTFTMTEEIVNAAIREGASRAGFEPGERVKLIDLLYGAALPSGADATAALAQYLAGSEEKYVEMMNEKAELLGLKQTHFVNASGLHHDDHYSTVREIAALMSYAMENELCRALLSAASYTTSATTEHPYGITLYSTTFSRMTTTSFGPVQVIAGKTGYTEEARFCLATLATRADGREYVLVTVGGSTKYAPVYDCDTMYGKYLF